VCEKEEVDVEVGGFWPVLDEVIILVRIRYFFEGLFGSSIGLCGAVYPLRALRSWRS